MSRKLRLSEGAECFLSDEFRAFAIRWLGFDPRDEEKYPSVLYVRVDIPHDGLVTFSVKQLGSMTEPGRTVEERCV